MSQRSNKLSGLLHVYLARLGEYVCPPLCCAVLSSCRCSCENVRDNYYLRQSLQYAVSQYKKKSLKISLQILQKKKYFVSLFINLYFFKEITITHCMVEMEYGVKGWRVVVYNNTSARSAIELASDIAAPNMPSDRTLSQLNYFCY